MGVLSDFLVTHSLYRSKQITDKKNSKVIGDKASSIDLSLLVFVLFKGRQYQRDATLSYCQLLIGRKRPKKMQAILLTIDGL